MLRNFKPIDHPIQKLHFLAQHLVCEVWCKADGNSCSDKIHADLKPIIEAYEWLKKDVEDIYEICKGLDDLQIVSDAFVTNNKIEDLCEGRIKPIYLSALPKVVEEKMKPLFVKFYNELLDRACLLYTSPSPRDATLSRMPSSA